MEAVNTLYAEGQEEFAEAILASLSRQVFDADVPLPSGNFRRWMAGGVFQLLRWTTRPTVRTNPDGTQMTVFRNRIIERSNHPYGMTLLEPSMADAASFVEGGDPMNAPYMMISPEISRNASTWDNIFLNSVQGKDVQIRFIWECQFSYKGAKSRLDQGKPVHLKAAAAGTGLSMILVFDRLIRDGYDPRLITATITDRDAGNVTKACRLLNKLHTTSAHLATTMNGPGISARTRDLLHPVPEAEAADPPYDVVTLIGILEYFSGFTCATTDEHLGHPASPAFSNAPEIIGKIRAMTAPSGLLVVNSYKVEIGARILEIFGKRLYFRRRQEMRALLESGGFAPTGEVGSGIVYDVEVFQKVP